jgi:hypothetical protein
MAIDNLKPEVQPESLEAKPMVRCPPQPWHVVVIGIVDAAVQTATAMAESGLIIGASIGAAIGVFLGLVGIVVRGAIPFAAIVGVFGIVVLGIAGTIFAGVLGALIGAVVGAVSGAIQGYKRFKHHPEETAAPAQQRFVYAGSSTNETQNHAQQ